MHTWVKDLWVRWCVSITKAIFLSSHYKQKTRRSKKLWPWTINRSWSDIFCWSRKGFEQYYQESSVFPSCALCICKSLDLHRHNNRSYTLFQQPFLKIAKTCCTLTKKINQSKTDYLIHSEKKKKPKRISFLYSTLLGNNYRQSFANRKENQCSKCMHWESIQFKYSAFI